MSICYKFGREAASSSADPKAVQSFVAKGKEQSTVQFLMHIIPNTAVGAFAEGEIVQVLLFSVLFVSRWEN